jgi:hypothetical protein
VGLLAAALLASIPGSGRAGASDVPEYEVKAAFLCNFGKFVEWPSGALLDGEAMVIGVLGRDPFGGALDKLSGRVTVQGRRLGVRRVNAMNELGRVQILFIAESKASALPEIIKALGKSPVLTVSDIDGFLDKGGAINLFLDESKVRFSVNLKATQRAGLKVSSQLLNVANGVRNY